MQPALYVNAGGHLSVVRAARENELAANLKDYSGPTVVCSALLAVLLDWG